MFCALTALVATWIAADVHHGLPRAFSQEAQPAPNNQPPKNQPPKNQPPKNQPPKKQPPVEQVPGDKGDLPQFEIIPDGPAAPDAEKPDAEKPDAKKPDAKKPVPPKGQPAPKPTKPEKRGKGTFQPLPEDPNLPAGTCPMCLGTTFVPHAKRVPYVHVENDRAPPIAMVIPWQFCPQCSAERDPQELVDQEQARLANAGATHLEWEKRMGMKLVRVETRHNALHCQMTPDVARRQGEASEAAIAYIQASTKSCFLTPLRPSTHEFLYLWDKATYTKSIGICRNIDEFKGGEDWHLYPQLACFNGGLTTVGNAAEGKQAPPEHLVISQVAVWNIGHATNGRAKHWLRIGFAYHTEYAVKNKVLMEYVKYQLNETRLGPNWANEARKMAGEGKLVRWRDLFDSDLQAWNPPHHVTAFATVTFLMRSDPVRFAKMNVLIRGGATAQEAIEKIYGRPIDQMEALFQKWVANSA
ncbi:MAG: hypothetical protein DCC68_20990 [Planctomycetota bacterium]|nr:MAG: hypothetical protein DCC68_20990 [Planctomycetota bacterium]